MVWEGGVINTGGICTKSAVDEHFKMRPLKLVYPCYPPFSQPLTSRKIPRSTPLYTIVHVSAVLDISFPVYRTLRWFWFCPCALYLNLPRQPLHWHVLRPRVRAAAVEAILTAGSPQLICPGVNIVPRAGPPPQGQFWFPQ